MRIKERFRAKKIIVTGAARGIGKAIAARLVLEGADVLVADIDSDMAEAVQAAIVGPGTAVACGVDIGRAESVDRMIRLVEEKWGRLDALVNNAAILDCTSLQELTIHRFNEVVSVNLNGALQCTLAALPLLEKAKNGRILNVASIMGLRGRRDAIAYGAAKGGLINLTRCLACELGEKGIIVNAIAPGYVDTRMAITRDGKHEHEEESFKEVYIKGGRLPLGRGGTAEDIAGPALFLISDDAKYITGQVLLVDGGISATF